MTPTRRKNPSGRRTHDAAANFYFSFSLTGILDGDPSGRILRANPAAASITGHEASALCGRPLADLVAPASADRFARHLALLHEQGISRSELHWQHPAGHEITVELASIQVDEQLFLHLFDDVSAQRAATAELQAARQAAEAANQAKSDFLANISHELRTPMSGLLGLAQLALRAEAGASQNAYLEQIVHSGRRLQRIVSDLIDTTRLESGRMDFEDAPFAIAELIADLADVRAQAVGKPLTVSVNVAPALPSPLLGDRLRLGQCLANLLGNAIKFTPQGEVTLRLDAIDTDAGALLRATVKDTGIGIPAAVLPRLFAPFTQADTSTARRYGGSGLGLAIARELARGMGGELVAESREGHGSCFTLTLPLRPATSASTPPDAAATALPDVPQEFRGRRILVAEDDATNQIIILDWLAQAGIDTALAVNGREVLAQLATATPPDLILMDVQMPELDGLETTRRLRAEGHTMPVVALSAGASAAEQTRCDTAGMSDFLPKPIDVDELWGCLTRWLPPAAAPQDAEPDTAEARFRGNADALARARAAFRASHAMTPSGLREAARAGDLPTLIRLAHALRGGAAAIGLTDLAERAAQLEADAVREFPRDGLDAAAETLADLLKNALTTLD